MFGKTRLDRRQEESEIMSAKIRNRQLEETVLGLLEIEKVERCLWSDGGQFKQTWKEYLPFNIKFNDNDQLVMTIDQYNSLKPSVQKRLRKLDLVTVPIDKNTDYLKLLEDIQKNDFAMSHKWE